MNFEKISTAPQTPSEPEMEDVPSAEELPDGLNFDSHLEAVNNIIASYEHSYQEKQSELDYHSGNQVQMAEDWPSVYKYVDGAYRRKTDIRNNPLGRFGARIASLGMKGVESYHRSMTEKLKGNPEEVIEEGVNELRGYLEANPDATNAVHEELASIDEMLQELDVRIKESIAEHRAKEEEKGTMLKNFEKDSLVSEREKIEERKTVIERYFNDVA